MFQFSNCDKACCLYVRHRGKHKVRTYKEYHSVCPSSELGLLPTPQPQASVPPPPCFWGEGNTRGRERGWESPSSDEGHTLRYSLYVCTLWREVSFQCVHPPPPPLPSPSLPMSGKKGLCNSWDRRTKAFCRGDNFRLANCIKRVKALGTGYSCSF